MPGQNWLLAMDNKNAETFRNKKIYEVNGYPAVTWPEHLKSVGDGGMVYVHSVIAHEKYGDYNTDVWHVHHINGDKWDWSQNNLILFEKSSHSSTHNKGVKRAERIKLKCKFCGDLFLKLKSSVDYRINQGQSSFYCGEGCFSKSNERINWPKKNELEEMVWEKPVSHLAEELGVSGKAIAKRCNKLGIETPGRGYWQKKKIEKAM